MLICAGCGCSAAHVDPGPELWYLLSKSPALNIHNEAQILGTYV